MGAWQPACGLSVHGLSVTFWFAAGFVDDNLQEGLSRVAPMEMLSAVMEWAYRAVATWYVAGIIGGVLILIAERLSRRREPSDADVRRAAERYRQWYGNDALAVIADHLVAASFAPDSRHKRFLRRVSVELQPSVISEKDRKQAIEHDRGI